MGKRLRQGKLIELRKKLNGAQFRNSMEFRRELLGVIIAQLRFDEAKQMNALIAADILNKPGMSGTMYEHMLGRIDCILVQAIEELSGDEGIDMSAGGRVFIGHGSSHVWRELKDFINDKLHLEYEEFNRVSVAGRSTASRLHEMLNEACFAFLLFTGEDEHSDGELHARENVIHEAGLFQGRLGFEKAIILLEEGCEEFSNIHGLQQIRFPKDNIMAKSEEIRDVLRREQIIE